MAQKKKIAKKAGKVPAKKSSAKAKPAPKKLVKKSTAKAIKKPAKKATAPKPSAKARPAKKSGKSAKTAGKAKVKSAAKASVSKAVAKAQILKPLDDRIVIHLKSFEKRTSGGLYIPDTADLSGNFQGTVVAVGQGHKNKKGKLRPMDVKPGDEVLFDQHAGSKLTLEGVEVRILRESEVLGIVETK